MSKTLKSWTVEETLSPRALLLWKIGYSIVLVVGLFNIANIHYFFATQRFLILGRIDDPFLEPAVMFISIALMSWGVVALFKLFDRDKLPATYTLAEDGVKIKNEDGEQFFRWDDVVKWRTAVEEFYLSEAGKIGFRRIPTLMLDLFYPLMEKRFGGQITLYIKTNRLWHKRVRILATDENKEEVRRLLQKLVFKSEALGHTLD